MSWYAHCAAVSFVIASISTIVAAFMGMGIPAVLLVLALWAIIMGISAASLDKKEPKP